MHEINKNIETKRLGIQISENKILGCLLWIDDVLLITDDGEEMLDITYNTTKPYHIEF